MLPRRVPGICEKRLGEHYSSNLFPVHQPQLQLHCVRTAEERVEEEMIHGQINALRPSVHRIRTNQHIISGGVHPETFTNIPLEPITPLASDAVTANSKLVPVFWYDSKLELPD